MGGKGDKPRPRDVEYEEYARRFDQAFGRPDTKKYGLRPEGWDLEAVRKMILSAGG